MNRNIGVKGHFDSDGITSALILKRWAHPRITSSILFHSKDGVFNGFRFKGVCIQVETGPLAQNTSYDANHHLYRVDTAAMGIPRNDKERKQHDLHNVAPTVVEYVRTT
jgi:hypothetical protein